MGWRWVHCASTCWAEMSRGAWRRDWEGGGLRAQGSRAEEKGERRKGSGARARSALPAGTSRGSRTAQGSRISEPPVTHVGAHFRRSDSDTHMHWPRKSPRALMFHVEHSFSQSLNVPRGTWSSGAPLSLRTPHVSGPRFTLVRHERHHQQRRHRDRAARPPPCRTCGPAPGTSSTRVCGSSPSVRCTCSTGPPSTARAMSIWSTTAPS